MENLQAALDELKSEVAGLDKQKTELTRDITSLKSKKAFLKTAVEDYEKSRDSAKIGYETTIKKLKAQESEAEEKITIALEDLDALIKQTEIAESKLEDLENQHEQEIIGHNKRLASVKNEVKAVETLKSDETKQLADITKQIPVRQARLDKLAATVRQAELDAESEIAELEQLVKTAKQRLATSDDKVEGVLKTLEDLTDQVKAKKAELAQLETEHQNFLAYEKRAMAALTARESALLAGEAELRVAQRRNPASILDNLG